VKKKLPADVLKWFSKQGKIGAKIRMEKLTPEQRSAFARLGGLAGGRGRPKRKAA